MNTSRRLVASALTFGLGLTLWGCSTDTITDQPVPGFVPNPAVPVAPGVTGISFPLFDTTTFQLPLPNDILRNTGAVDPTKKGLVDFPNVAPFLSEPFTSMETIRGFSTTGNIIIPFSGRIDAASVTPQSLLLVEGASSTISPEPSGTNATIPYTVVVRNPEPSTTGNSTIVMTPLRPLKPATNYYVTMTTAIRGNGRSIGTAPAMQASKQTSPLTDPQGNNNIFPVPQDTALTLEGLRVGFQPFWQRAESILGTGRENIPIVFRFGTEPELAALAGLRVRAIGNPNANPPIPSDVVAFVPPNPNPQAANASPFRFVAALADLGNTDPTVRPQVTVAQLSEAQLTPLVGGLAPTVAAILGNPAVSVDAFYTNSTDLGPNHLNLSAVPHQNVLAIFTGAVTLRNYMQSHGAAGLFWDGEGFSPTLPPIADSTNPGPILPHPFLVIAPVSVLNSLAQNPPPPNKVVIYQHGVGRSKDDAFLIANELCGQGFTVVAIDLPFHGGGTFGANPLAQALPPGVTAETAFFNLGNPRAARDNFRQSVVNLHYLTQVIAFGQAVKLPLPPPLGNGALQLPVLNTGAPGVPTIHFLGHSLGALVGGVYTATDFYNLRAVLSSGGGRLTQTLLNSGTRGPAVLAQLAQNNLTPGSQGFDLFWLAAQTVLDDGDAINYAAPGLEGILKPSTALASRVLQQEMIGDNTIPNSSTRDLATAYSYDSNAFGFNPAKPTPYRHVQTVLQEVATLIPIAAPYVDVFASGLSQFQPGGHESLLGIGASPAVIASLRAQITTFFSSATPTIQAGQ